MPLLLPNIFFPQPVFLMVVGKILSYITVGKRLLLNLYSDFLNNTRLSLGRIYNLAYNLYRNLCISMKVLIES